MKYTILDQIDLRILRAFELLFDKRSVTKAAVEMNLSQPAMSRLLGRARKVFRDDLFIASPQGLTPTPKAEKIAPQCRAILSRVASLVEEEEFDPITCEDVFTFSATDYIAWAVLAPLYNQLLAAAPGARFETHHLQEDVFKSSRDGRHMAIGSFPKPQGNFRRVSLYRDTFVTLMRKGHPYAGRKLSKRDFADARHLLVTVTGRGKGDVDSALSQANLKARTISVRTPHFLTVPHILRTTDLLTTLPRRLGEKLAAQHNLLLLEPPISLRTFTVWMVWHERFQNDAAHKWLRRQILNATKAI